MPPPYKPSCKAGKRSSSTTSRKRACMRDAVSVVLSVAWSRQQNAGSPSVACWDAAGRAVGHRVFSTRWSNEDWFNRSSPNPAPRTPAWVHTESPSALSLRA
eukprot:153664-Chlamydomonas_euryale.AAC.3